ncbi:hypothetical protein [Ensifer sp. MJa1]|uniref:hypothetical protein n=1 Tax=Ensifer sp. MJa1 TaxID=2919888 RepID=UPI00300BACFB
MAVVTVAFGLVCVALPLAAEDSARLTLEIELADGTSQAAMVRKCCEIAALLGTIPEVTQIYAFRQPAAGDRSCTNGFAVQLTLSHKSERLRSQETIAAEIAARMTSVTDIRSHQLGLTGGRQFAFALLGDDLPSLTRQANCWKAQCKT